VKKTTRTIYVFEQGNSKVAIRIEVEGETVSAQVVNQKDPNSKLKFVLPVFAAMLLVDVLSSALAQSGEVVNEVSIVRQDVDAGSSNADVVGG
jgi:hypothetical protein